MSVKTNAQQKLNRFVRTRYDRIYPEPRQGMFNFKCFHNAAEYVRLNPTLLVVECIYIEDNVPILHYINFDPSTGAYLETTLGYQAPQFEYYKIRTIDKADYPYMESEFTRARNSWNEQFLLPVLARLFRIKTLV